MDDEAVARKRVSFAGRGQQGHLVENVFYSSLSFRTQELVIMISMKLFDDSRPCVNSWEKIPNPPKFAFCNSDWILGDKSVLDNSPVRDRCERWFQRIPEGKRADLRGEFRSTVDSAHDGAFFELFLHELFTDLGCEVEFQPSISGKTPDFLLYGKNGPFIVEATVAGGTSNPLDLGPNEQKVLDDLNKLRSPHFHLLYDVENTPNATPSSTKPSAKHVTNKVKKLLVDNDPNDVRSVVENFGRKAAPSEKIEWRDGTMTVWLSPRLADVSSQDISDRIVISRMNAKRIDPISSIHRALEVKASAYNTLTVPLLLAVNAANPFFSLDRDALHILWGDLHSRKGNGFWSRSRSANVAGVLIFRNADILHMSQSYATWYLNPRYCGPTPPSALLRLPHYIEVDGVPVRMEGENVAEVLGLNWS